MAEIKEMIVDLKDDIAFLKGKSVYQMLYKRRKTIFEKEAQ